MIFKAFNALFLIVILFVSSSYAQNIDSQSADTNGIIDLRKESFENAYSLKGKWAFFWKKLIAPEDSNPTAGVCSIPNEMDGSKNRR